MCKSCLGQAMNSPCLATAAGIPQAFAAASDSSLVTQLSDSLMGCAIGRSPASGGNANESSVQKALKSDSVEPVVGELLAWIDCEISATRLENPLVAASADLAENMFQVSSKHSTFDKMLREWNGLCSCGENRTGCFSAHSFFFFLVMRLFVFSMCIVRNCQDKSGMLSCAPAISRCG